MIKKLIAIKKTKIQDLGLEEQEALKAVDDRKIEIERRIKILEGIKTQITYNLVARPSVELFSSTGIDYDVLDEMREFPCESKFRMDDFEPGGIEIATLEREFGDLLHFTDETLY
ncbi:hypothetical protein MHBO_004936 [Bonamia ostreae]|uniref:Uncharacterized protein n=1 Tax=Bonamia ostreae TaxID=126728 RepID=A0ABV2AUN5_9EUKA